MELTINETLQQAITMHQEGRLEEAESLYRKVLEAQPTNLDANNNLGIILEYSGKLKDAEISYKKAIKFKSDFAEAYNNLGSTLVKLNKFFEAEASYKKAVQFKPDYAKAYYNLGNTLQKLEKSNEAEINYKKAIELKPDYAEAYNNLGTIFQNLNRQEEAEKNYKKAIELNPKYAIAYNNLGAALIKLNRLAEAEKSFNKAIELQPMFEGALINRGQILFNRGEFESALKDFEACNSEDSRSRVLASLYSLRRIDDIYKRIEKNSQLDAKNIAVASFSAFISKKEKRVTAHKFCNNPLDLIKVSNLSTHFNNSNLFINEVINELNNVKTRWEPYGKSTHKGFQSTGKNLFENSSKKLLNLKSIIDHEIDSYCLKFKDEDCTFIKQWPLKTNLIGSYVLLKQYGHQESHIHVNGWLSGVIYLKVVTPLVKDEGAIELSLNGENYFDANLPKHIHQPKEGDMIFFPSSLHHRTIPFTSDEDRIVVAFDLNPFI